MSTPHRLNIKMYVNMYIIKKFNQIIIQLEPHNSVSEWLG